MPAGVASSDFFLNFVGSRLPEHCAHCLWRLTHGSEHVRAEQPGHLYFDSLMLLSISAQNQRRQWQSRLDRRC